MRLQRGGPKAGRFSPAVRAVCPLPHLRGARVRTAASGPWGSRAFLQVGVNPGTAARAGRSRPGWARASLRGGRPHLRLLRGSLWCRSDDLGRPEEEDCHRDRVFHGGQGSQVAAGQVGGEPGFLGQGVAFSEGGRRAVCWRKCLGTWHTETWWLQGMTQGRRLVYVAARRGLGFPEWPGSVGLALPSVALGLRRAVPARQVHTEDTSFEPCFSESSQYLSSVGRSRGFGGSLGRRCHKSKFLSQPLPSGVGRLAKLSY